MRKLIRTLGIALGVGGTLTWVLLGANTGWTKTRVQVVTLDPVTEIEQRTWEDKFLPGVDFLVAADTVALLLVAASFLGRKKTP